MLILPSYPRAATYLAFFRSFVLSLVSLLIHSQYHLLLQTLPQACPRSQHPSDRSSCSNKTLSKHAREEWHHRSAWSASSTRSLPSRRRLHMPFLLSCPSFTSLFTFFHPLHHRWDTSCLKSMVQLRNMTGSDHQVPTDSFFPSMSQNLTVSSETCSGYHDGSSPQLTSTPLCSIAVTKIVVPHHRPRVPPAPPRMLCVPRPGVW